MSNFRSKAFNPTSKRVEVAEYCDDYYGRHRYGIRFDDGCVHPEAQCGIDAAATQLDSILKERDALRNEINDWANEVARYKSYAEKFDQENAALQVRVKELEDGRNFWKSERDRIKAFLSEGDWQTVKSEQAWRNRALRAEQERDEAYERAAAIADRIVMRLLDLDTAKERAMSDTAKRIAARIRRLESGPEKEGK